MGSVGQSAGKMVVRMIAQPVKALLNATDKRLVWMFVQLQRGQNLIDHFYRSIVGRVIHPTTTRLHRRPTR